MSTKRGLIYAVAIGMLMIGAVWAGTGETNVAAQRPHEGKGFGGHFMTEFKQLNLTTNQSQQIELIMKDNHEAMQAAMTKAREMREALDHQIQAGPFDEQSVRAACQKAAAAGEEAAVLHAKVAGQIRAVLTSDQQAALDKIRSDARNTMHKPFAKGRGRMDKQIDGPSAP